MRRETERSPGRRGRRRRAEGGSGYYDLGPKRPGPGRKEAFEGEICIVNRWCAWCYDDSPIQSSGLCKRCNANLLSGLGSD